MNRKTRYVRCPRCRNVLREPTDVPVYKCGGCDTTLQAKKRNNNSITVVNTTSQRSMYDDSFGKQKVEQVFGDQDKTSNQQLMLDSADDESDHDHDDLHYKAVNDSIQAFLLGKLKMKQLSNDHEASSSSSGQQQLVVNNDIHNDPRSSTELSGHEDPESSPEATAHNRIDQEQEQIQDQDQDQDAGKKQENTTADATSIDTEQINKISDDNESLNQQLMVNSINDLDQNNDHDEPPHNSYDNRIDEDYHDDVDQEFLSCRHDDEFEESGSEFDEAFGRTRTFRDSDLSSNSKSSFRSLIAEKLLDTRLKKPMRLDEDSMLSEDESADLHHHRRFNHINSIETKETARLGGKSFYEYEGSVSSFDGNDNHAVRKHRLGKVGDENVGSGGSGYRFNRIHPLNGFGVNFKHRSHMIPGNPKTERIELLKLVRKLQDQLERTNISNPQQVPLYNNHNFNNTGRYGPRMAFSGETTAVNRRLDGGSCPHCCPQDRPFSAQLPRQHVCCNRPHYEPNAYYSPRFSALSSPVHDYSDPEFSAAVTKRVRSPKKKRYVRPIAGGSPWIACYWCSKLLELPQSFLVFNKRYHSLKCGACLKTLNFTLSNGTHVSRYYAEETIAAPPCSEVEDTDGLNGPWAGPVSCSDDSFQKSYSTETDRNEFSAEKRKLIISRDPSGSTQLSSSRVSGQRKMTSGSKGPNGSELHRLMGYASVSRVIRG